MSLSNNIAERINQIEAWVATRPRPLVLCPLRLLCVCLLFVVQTVGNLLAVVRWPFSLIYRIARSRRPYTLGETVHADLQRLEELFKQDLPVVVDFWAEWCAPCLLMSGVLAEFAKSEASRVIVAKVDTTLHPKLAIKHKIGGLPTMLLFRRGEEVGKHAGIMTIDQLRKLVGEHCEHHNS